MLQPASAQPNLLSPPANLSMLSIGSRGQFRENLSPSPNVHHVRLAQIALSTPAFFFPSFRFCQNSWNAIKDL